MCLKTLSKGESREMWKSPGGSEALGLCEWLDSRSTKGRKIVKGGFDLGTRSGSEWRGGMSSCADLLN